MPTQGKPPQRAAGGLPTLLPDAPAPVTQTRHPDSIKQPYPTTGQSVFDGGLDALLGALGIKGAGDSRAAGYGELFSALASLMPASQLARRAFSGARTIEGAVPTEKVIAGARGVSGAHPADLTVPNPQGYSPVDFYGPMQPHEKEIVGALDAGRVKDIDRLKADPLADAFPMPPTTKELEYQRQLHPLKKGEMAGVREENMREITRLPIKTRGTGGSPDRPTRAIVPRAQVRPAADKLPRVRHQAGAMDRHTAGNIRDWAFEERENLKEFTIPELVEIVNKKFGVTLDKNKLHTLLKGDSFPGAGSNPTYRWTPSPRKK